MNNSYVKPFNSLLYSSIWLAPDYELRVWIAILLLKGRDHTVTLSVANLAHLANVMVEDCGKAIEHFLSPDPNSNNREFEGRRLSKLEGGGWLVLNGEKYANMMSRDQLREYNRQKQAEYRARKKSVEHEGKCDGAQSAINEGLQQ
jgi:hypothetical protein